MSADDDTALRDGGMPRGQKRTNRMAFEMPPPQLLHAYGRANYSTMDDADVWIHLRHPLHTGAASMTEYTSEDAETRGIAVNHWLRSLLEYLEYQLTDEGISRNNFFMNENLYISFTAEIERIMPHVRRCMAPDRRIPETPTLRSGVYSRIVATEVVRENDLNASAQVLHSWADPQKPSCIRRTLEYQGCGGLPYVASVHQLVTQCFLQYGNAGHRKIAAGGRVSVTEFQEAVRERYVRKNGIINQEENIDDFSVAALG